MAMHGCSWLPSSARSVWTRTENLIPGINPPCEKKNIHEKAIRSKSPSPRPPRSKGRTTYLWPMGWFNLSQKIRVKPLLKSGTKHGKRLNHHRSTHPPRTKPSNTQSMPKPNHRTMLLCSENRPPISDFASSSSSNLSSTKKPTTTGVEKSPSTKETTAPPCKAHGQNERPHTSHRPRSSLNWLPRPQYTEPTWPRRRDLAWHQRTELSSGPRTWLSPRRGVETN